MKKTPFRKITRNSFKKDLKKLKKQNKDPLLLKEVMEKIINKERLDRKYRNHILKGNYKNRNECHIEPDWLLIYKIDKENNMVIFERTGSHSELF